LRRTRPLPLPVRITNNWFIRYTSWIIVLHLRQHAVRYFRFFITRFYYTYGQFRSFLFSVRIL
jgi:hypothetical protein